MKLTASLVGEKGICCLSAGLWLPVDYKRTTQYLKWIFFTTNTTPAMPPLSSCPVYRWHRQHRDIRSLLPAFVIVVMTTIRSTRELTKWGTEVVFALGLGVWRGTKMSLCAIWRHQYSYPSGGSRASPDCCLIGSVSSFWEKRFNLFINVRKWFWIHWIRELLIFFSLNQISLHVCQWFSVVTGILGIIATK